MLRFFRSLFGHPTEPLCCPELFTREAIERAVDATDPALRSVSAYERKLRPAVLCAVNHVVAMVDAFAAPIDCRPELQDSDPRLKAFFISPDHLRQTLAKERHLTAWRAASGGKEAVALLIMELREKRAMGVGRINGVMQQGVAQTTVSFTAHRLVDLTADEADTRRLLQTRGFDQLLAIALRRLTAASALRAELQQRSALLQAKIDLLRRGQWGFNLGGPAQVENVAMLESDLEDIGTILSGLGDSADYLERNLELVAEVLRQPAEHFWLEPTRLIMDAMGIRHQEATNGAWEVPLQLVHNDGRTLAVALVRVG